MYYAGLKLTPRFLNSQLHCIGTVVPRGIGVTPSPKNAHMDLESPNVNQMNPI